MELFDKRELHERAEKLKKHRQLLVAAMNAVVGMINSELRWIQILEFRLQHREDDEI